MFDDALLESRRKRTCNGKRFSLPLALGFHAAVIGAFLGASVWFTGEAPEPVIAVVFPASSSAPPPPLGGGEVHTVPSNSRPLVPIQAMVQPVLSQIEDSKADGDAGQALPGPSDPAPNGPGRPTGVPDGTGPLGSDPVGSTDAPEEIRRPGGDVHAPVLLQRAEPDYPEAARRARLQGTVILEAIITASGAVEEIRVLRPLNPLLDEAAERAVRQWRYRPATLNGRAVPVYLTVTVRFGING